MLAGCNQYGIGWDAIQADLDAKYAVERDKRDAERAKETQEAEAREAERKRCETKGGPVVGMTKAQVYAMCGKPSRINTTQTARGSSDVLLRAALRLPDEWNRNRHSVLTEPPNSSRFHLVDSARWRQNLDSDLGQRDDPGVRIREAGTARARTRIDATSDRCLHRPPHQVSPGPNNRSPRCKALQRPHTEGTLSECFQ
jgi:hypothetical protein